ncbi:MAG: PQQ-binding-like beta-propeller repeat protein [Candidatus Bathyarchaeota archaeon]|nr:PQQ-binding-like beta-propeller repeat protein [Candidatus Bathyarchaeum sp.]
MKKTKKYPTKITTIVLTLILTISAMLITIPTINAQDQDTWNTFAYIAVTPDPVGVGQSVYLIMWVSPNPPTAIGVAGDRWRDMTVTVNTPNGDVETLGPWDSDPTGSTWGIYTPTQIGTYTFTLDYPGQVLSLTGPTGITADISDVERRGSAHLVGDTFLGSSDSVSITVQQDPIQKIPDYPLPSEYWTRPIEGQNTAWAGIASHWLNGAQIGSWNDLWQEDGTAPNSAHVMWSMPIEFGGVVGGTSSYAIPAVGFYSGGAYEGRFSAAMIMCGRLYFQLPLNHAGGSRASGAGYICVDLRTGEEIWLNEELGVPYTGLFSGSARPTIKGQLFNYESLNQHGVVGGTIWQVAGTTWIGYDAWTGNWIYNLTNVPSGFEVYTDYGAIVRYVLDYDDDSKSGSIALWNNTQHNVGLEATAGYGAGTTSEDYQWRPMGKSVDMSEAYSWTVSITADLTGRASPSILNVIPGDMILGTSTNFREFGRLIGTPDPYTVWAISDRDDGTRGQLLWKKDYSAPAGGIGRFFPSGNPIDEENRVFLMQDTETMQWLAYSLDTGDLVWGPVGSNFRAFQYYGSGSGGGQRGFVAYGNLYVQSYGGEIHCYDCSDGRLLWKYDNTNSGVEAIWGNYPIFITAIADGKVYAFNNEHSPNYPLYKGERMRCIDAYTGDEVWTIMSWAGQIGGGGNPTGILAEGYLTYYNYYDNQVYCVGKGPSETTVTIQDNSVAKGEGVMITGMVIDTASGTQQDEQAARFPKGVPAVSDESMGVWMEYVYMQKPCPANVKGVEVTLDAIDPNGNFVHIGRVTSDGYGQFMKMWTPEIEGEYTVIATFEGSNSYWPSYSETAVGVGPAVAPTTPIEPEEPVTEAPLISTEVAIILAVVAACIVVVVAFWLVRRRK